MQNLVLYHFDACPYCQRVRRSMAELKIEDKVELKDTRKDPANRQALISLTGGTQVPCLVIDGKPMLESSDIIRWMEQQFGSATGASPRGRL